MAIAYGRVAIVHYLCPAQQGGSAAAFGSAGGGGKSGQHRAPSFLTGRFPQGNSSVTENNRLRPACGSGKGEKVG